MASDQRFEIREKSEVFQPAYGLWIDDLHSGPANLIASDQSGIRLVHGLTILDENGQTLAADQPLGALEAGKELTIAEKLERQAQGMLDKPVPPASGNLDKTLVPIAESIKDKVLNPASSAQTFDQLFKNLSRVEIESIINEVNPQLMMKNLRLVAVPDTHEIWIGAWSEDKGKYVPSQVIYHKFPGNTQYQSY